MRQAKRRDTGPELALRRELHRRGLRYRVDRPLPGMPRRRCDIWFGPARVAVFVDGCFWHGCPDHSVVPRSNREWWLDKIRTNAARDRDTDRRLEESGILVMRFWEHDDPRRAADRIERTVNVRRNA